MLYFLLERSMDMLNSIHQEPSQSYGILNEEVNRNGYMVGSWIIRGFICIITIDYSIAQNRRASNGLLE